LFVAIGNADLSNKMSIVYDGSEVFAIKTFHSHPGPSVAVERKHGREFAVRVTPPRHTINRIVKQLEETGSVINLRKGASAGHLFVRKKLSVQHGR
jgi:hypothetical protein